MRILVIGATGGTGLALVEQAVDRAVEVVAVVRDPAKLGGLGSRVDARRADAFDPAVIAEAASGASAALSTIGARAGLLSRGRTTVYSRAADALIRGLPRAHVKRLIFCTSAGVEPHDPAEAIPYRLIAKPLFLQRGYDDMAKAEELIRASRLDWTLVRPARLTDQPPSHRWQVSPRLRTPGGRGISRADLATFMLDQIDDPVWLRSTPTLTSPKDH